MSAEDPKPLQIPTHWNHEFAQTVVQHLSHENLEELIAFERDYWARRPHAGRLEVARHLRKAALQALQAHHGEGTFKELTWEVINVDEDVALDPLVWTAEQEANKKESDWLAANPLVQTPNTDAQSADGTFNEPEPGFDMGQVPSVSELVNPPGGDTFAESLAAGRAAAEEAWDKPVADTTGAEDPYFRDGAFTTAPVPLNADQMPAHWTHEFGEFVREHHFSLPHLYSICNTERLVRDNRIPLPEAAHGETRDQLIEGYVATVVKDLCDGDESFPRPLFDYSVAYDPSLMTYVEGLVVDSTGVDNEALTPPAEAAPAETETVSEELPPPPAEVVLIQLHPAWSPAFVNYMNSYWPDDFAEAYRLQELLENDERIAELGAGESQDVQRVVELAIMHQMVDKKWFYRRTERASLNGVPITTMSELAQAPVAPADAHVEKLPAEQLTREDEPQVGPTREFHERFTEAPLEAGQPVDSIPEARANPRQLAARLARVEHVVMGLGAGVELDPADLDPPNELFLEIAARLERLIDQARTVWEEEFALPFTTTEEYADWLFDQHFTVAKFELAIHGFHDRAHEFFRINTALHLLQEYAVRFKYGDTDHLS